MVKLPKQIIDEINTLIYNSSMINKQKAQKMITETEFEKLPKEIQKARWDYFLASDGYYDEEILKERNIKKIKRMISALEKMKSLGDWGPNPEIWLNKLKETAG